MPPAAPPRRPNDPECRHLADNSNKRRAQTSAGPSLGRRVAVRADNSNKRSAHRAAGQGRGYPAAVISARAQAMLSGPPASLASVISRATTCSGDSAASASVSLIAATGTAAVSPSEQSR